MFCKAISAIKSDSSDRSKQSKLKAFCKVVPVLDAIKNICYSWEEVKILILTGVWEKLVVTLMDDFEGLKNSVEEVNCMCGGNRKRARIRKGA